MTMNHKDAEFVAKVRAENAPLADWITWELQLGETMKGIKHRLLAMVRQIDAERAAA